MKNRFSRRWSTLLLLFWGLQTFALPVPSGSSAQREAITGHTEGLAASLLSRNALNQPQERPRRKVADMDVTSGPVEYMKQLRSSLTNEDGSPTMEREDDPTNVWGLVDRDIVQNTFRAKPDSAKCLTINQFIFGWKSLVDAYQLQPLPLQKAILRSYLDVIPRFVQNRPVDMDITIKAKLLQSVSNESSTVVTEERIAVDMESDSWKEFDITGTIQQLWPPAPEDADREIEVTLELRVDCQRNKKVPGSFVNPATISLSQKKRRERHSPLQPLLLIYLSDQEIKKIVRDEISPSETHQTGGDNSTQPRVARSVEATKACSIEDFPITFHSLHLFDVLVPATYNAKKCSGSCSHSTLSRNDHLATNHAKLMASAKIVSQIKPDVYFSSPPADPCCVPVKYRPYALIVQTPEGGAEYVVYPSMVVDECGCR